MNDVIEDWRRWRRSLALIGRVACTIYSILEISAALFFPMIKHNKTKVSADALSLVRKFSFGTVYTAFVGNLLYRVSHKMIICAVLLESFKNFKIDTQVADIRRTFRRTNIGELT